MLLLIGTILGIIIGISLIKINNDWGDSDYLLGIGLLFIIGFSILLIVEIACLFYKPFEYNKFVINYETIKEIQTSEKDIRDTNYTKELIEINKQIRTARKYKDNPWIGIFYNEKIAEAELLNKENIENE